MDVIQYHREYYKAHQEDWKKYYQDYYLKNKARIKAQVKGYQKNHRPLINLYRRNYRQNHLELVRKQESRQSKRWHIGRPEVAQHGWRRCHYRERNAIGNHTLEEWMELKRNYNHTCPICGKKEPEIQLTEDHIIPLSKGGTNFILNIQPLCGSCNSRKFNHLP